jgi:hypothetical protein
MELTETVAELDHIRVCKGQFQAEWSKQLILNEKERQDSCND